jgi:hypothetical protein
MLDEKVAMLEEIRDFLLQSFALARGSFGPYGGKPTTLERRLSHGQFLTNLGHRAQNRLGQLLDDVGLYHERRFVWRVGLRASRFVWRARQG